MFGSFELNTLYKELIVKVSDTTTLIKDKMVVTKKT